jgi:hypothetical protein
MTMTRLFLSALLLSWLTACVGAGSNTPVTPLAVDQFPKVQGISLLGDDVALPEGFEGEVNLVSMGFEHKHQLDINTWIDAVPDLSEAFPTFRFYEVPVIYEAGPLFRWWLNNGMRIGVVEEEARKRTITVYTDRTAFSQAIDLASLDEIHTVLLDAEGRILWRRTGPASEKEKRALISAIERHLGP